MKNIFLTYLFINTIISNAFCQIDISDNIINKKTTEHKNILNTKVFMKLPKGYQSSKQFIGYSIENSGVQIIDLQGGNYYTNGKNVTKENFESRGFKVTYFKVFKLNSFDAKFITVYTPEGTMHNLIFGDTTFSVSAMAMIAKENYSLNKEIINSLLSIVYEKDFITDYYKNAPFNFESEIFKFAMYSGGMYLFNSTGKIPEGTNSELMIQVMTFPNVGAENIAHKNLMEINDKINGIFLTKNSGKLMVKKYEAFETENYALIDNKKQLLYQLVVVHGEIGILIQALAFDEFDKNLELLKKFSKSIQIK